MNDKIEWVLVPREATEAMVEAICLQHARSVWPADYDPKAQHIRRESAKRGYAAMLAAAPKPEAQAVCTCPSGDGSLRWPCPSHPASHDAQQLDDLLSKLPKWIDGIPRDLFIKRLKAALPTPGSHEWQPAEEVYVREADGAYTLCDLQETTFDEAPLYHARQSEAQQPAVVGDGVHSLPAEWRATAARHRSRGTGQSVAQANGYDMAANMLEAALTPAATPGEQKGDGDV